MKSRPAHHPEVLPLGPLCLWQCFPFRWEIDFAQTYLIYNQILERIKITTCVLFWCDHHVQCSLLRYILQFLLFLLKHFDLLKHQITAAAAGELHPV